MKIPVGHTPDGQPVVVETATVTVLLLVGDAGVGKTTLARHLARWWNADPDRRLRGCTTRPHEYRDTGLEPLTPREPASADPATLTILDTGDDLEPGVIHAHATAPGLCVVTAADPVTQDCCCRLPRHLCLGLLPATAGEPTAAADVQGRLDWPDHVTPVIPRRFGDHDAPPHRWQTLRTSR